MKKSEIIKRSIEENLLNKEEILSNVVSKNTRQNDDVYLKDKGKSLALKIVVAVALVMSIINLEFIPKLMDGIPTLLSGKSSKNLNGRFNELSIVVYAADDSGKKSEVTLQPNIESSIGKYTPAMSSVPGFPFKCSGENIEHVEFEVDYGEFILWGSDYKVAKAGKKANINKDSFIYWSPLSNEPMMVKEANITVTIRTKDHKDLKKYIRIGTDENYLYYVKLIE